MAAGAARAALEVHRCADWRNGTVWLASSRAAGWILPWGLVGAAVGVVLALILWRRVDRPRAGWLLRLPLLALALVAAWALLENPIGSLRAGSRPSVILVSIDTLRADRLLGPRGAETMPRLSALLRDGTTFERATSAAPWTLPSHVSLFTSLLPFDHGVRWTRHAISAGRATLAERFRDAGYRTAAFAGASYVSASFGLSHGFEVYEDHDEEKERGSAGIFSGALRWARRHRDVPFFLFVHTYEPHTPYRNAGQVRLPRGRLGEVFGMTDVQAVQGGRLHLTEEERRYVEALYDADVRGADAHVGEFLAGLRQEGVLDRAILVVLSDHGEDLWNHAAIRSPGHGHSLYEELVHVPLAFRAPGRVRGGAAVATPVSLLDVAPTLLELCDLSPDPAHRGRSLAGALRSGTEPDGLPVLAESVQYGPDRFSLRSGALKVILTPYPERVHNNVHLPVRPVELYDLDADPLERDPESGRAHDGLARALGAVMERSRRVLGRQDAGAADRDRLPDELRDQLRSLGYVH
jgi:arylsulfatase A-like enzyme